MRRFRFILKGENKGKLTENDRGQARYFHGRKEILANFSDELYSAIGKRYVESGTIFLIQGAPGAGKTALLHRFKNIAAAGGDEVGGKKWNVLEIDETALYKPASLMMRAGESYKLSEVTARSRRLQAGIPKIFGGGRERTITHQYADPDMLQTLQILAHRKPLLLVLDEVQTLTDGLDSRETKHLRVALKHIHNGSLAKPVVLACGGLGNSRDVFAGLGISRFKSNRLVNLGRLSEASERAIIRDWLVRDGGAQEADIQPWLSAIARETYGWPQHIAIYAQAAAKRLKAQKGQVTPEDLDWVLQNGRIGKRDYYRQRSDFLSTENCRALAYTIQDTSRSGGFGKKTLLKGFVDKGKMSQEESFQLFQDLLHRGVLSRVESDVEAYDVPIPSMKDHLFKAAGLKV